MIFTVMIMFIVFTMLFHFKDKKTLIESITLSTLLVPAWLLIGHLVNVLATGYGLSFL